MFSSGFELSVTTQALVGGLVLLIIKKLFFDKKSQHPLSPPWAISSWIPLLGSGPLYSYHFRSFLKRNHDSYGQVFKTKLGNQIVVFINDVHFTRIMTKKSNIFSFLQNSAENAAKLFFLNATPETHKKLVHWGIKYMQGPKLEVLTDSFVHHVNLHTKDVVRAEWNEDSLFSFSNTIVFRAGNQAFVTSNHIPNDEYDSLLKSFEEFDKQVILIASGLIPDWIFKKARDGQKHMTSFIVDTPAAERSEFVNSISEIFDPDSVDFARLAFTLAWGLNANSMPAIFWLIYYLLKDEKSRSRISEQIHDVLLEDENWNSQTATSFPQLSCQSLKKMTFLASYFKDVLRTQSSIAIVRQVTEDVTVPVADREYHFKKGELTFLNNPHYDPEMFPDPEIPKIETFLDEKHVFVKNEKQVRLPSHFFGAGGSICPGRFFSILEGTAMAAKILTCFDMELVNPQLPTPPPDFERINFGCMPLDPRYKDHDSIKIRHRLKSQFVVNPVGVGA